MATYLSGGGGRPTYRLDLDMIKSPSTSWTSNSSSPSSTLSESSNSSRTISTRKARTPRKRPNQIYHEAAAILSTAYPKLFPANKFTKSYKPQNPFFLEPSDLFMPLKTIDTSGFLIHPPIRQKPNFINGVKELYLNGIEKGCRSPGEITSEENYSSEICDGYEEDFDAESILDEEIDEGIDSIMGNLSMENKSIDEKSNEFSNFSYGFPVGLGFDLGNGMRREFGAIRNVDEANWWRFPSVGNKAKKMKKKVEIKSLLANEKNNSVAASKADGEKKLVSESAGKESIGKTNAGLLLKLNYGDVLDEWSDKESPFGGDAPVTGTAGNDVQARLAQIDLFPEEPEKIEGSGVKSKGRKHTPSASKKTKQPQVPKVGTNQRSRRKGRFVRTPGSETMSK